jgi:hypothetical protein
MLNKNKELNNMNYKRKEIEQYFLDYLNDNLDYHKEHEADTWTEDLHHNCFNTDYYIIGRYKATQWLGEEVFHIINFIKEYEMNNFGEVFTDLSEPERVVNMYTYIVGEEIVNDYLYMNNQGVA